MLLESHCSLFICRARASVRGQGRRAWRWESRCAAPGTSAGRAAPAPSESCTGCRALRSRSPEQCCRSHSASPLHRRCKTQHTDTAGRYGRWQHTGALKTRSLRAIVLQRRSSSLSSIRAGMTSHPCVPPAPSTVVTETPFTSQDLVGLKWVAAFCHLALDLN